MRQALFIDGIFHQAFTQSGYIPETDLSETIQNRFPFSNFSIAAFSLSGKYETDAFQRQLVSAVPKYAADHTTIPVWSYRTENNENLLILNHTADFPVTDYIRNIHTYFSERYSCPTFWGVSRPCLTLSEFLFAKKEALTAFTFSLQKEQPDIIAYTAALKFQAENPSQYFYPDAAGNLLVKGLKNGDLSLIDFIITVLKDENTKIKTLNPECFIQFNNALTNTFMSLNSSKYHFSDELLQLNQKALSCLSNPEEYFSLLQALCRTISEALNSTKISRKKALMHEIQEYIQNNYHNANLNLSGIAQHFQISEGYCSVLFKETSGVCFAEYLEKCRIDKSCILLSDTQKTILEIAAYVGYNSVYSFRRAFKRLFHVSPSQYREAHSAVTAIPDES